MLLSNLGCDLQLLTGRNGQSRPGESRLFHWSWPVTVCTDAARTGKLARHLAMDGGRYLILCEVAVRSS